MESFHCPDECCLTDERLDGCKEFELHCLEFCIESS
jgi:hypothetical protein